MLDIWELRIIIKKVKKWLIRKGCLVHSGSNLMNIVLFNFSDYDFKRSVRLFVTEFEFEIVYCFHSAEPT